MGRTLILGHARSDFDALAATVAAAKLYPGAIALLHEDLDPSVRAFASLHKDALGLKALEEVDLAEIDHVVVVDTARPERLGKAMALLERPEVRWTVVDHHPQLAGDLPTGAGGQRVAVGAATTLLVECLQSRPDLPLSPIEATALALGIYADTLGLSTPQTTARDLRAAAHLLEAGADLSAIAHWRQQPLNEEQRELLAVLLDGLRTTTVGPFSLTLAHAQWPTRLNGIAQVAHALWALAPADVLLVAVAMGGHVQVVGRARHEGASLLPSFEGLQPKGHAHAVAARCTGRDPAEVLAQIQARLGQQLGPEANAAQLMSSPVNAIGPDEPLEAAAELLDRWGHTGAPVVADGRVVGMLSRRDLDRAKRLGLMGWSARRVMVAPVTTALPTEMRSQLLQRMVAKDVGRLPVVDGAGRLLGLVTRSDLLVGLYGEGAKAAAPRFSAEAMAEAWGDEAVALLRRVGEALGERPAYLVGGAVRDLLLGRADSAPDLDLMVEAPEEEAAEAILAGLGKPRPRLRRYPGFGTLAIELAGGRKLDLARARLEYYERPGAMPVVVPATLKQDLARRDFTVNALALDLHPQRFGQVVDPLGALGDLDAKALRSFHPLSFLEDPSRVLRALRLEAQLGFGLVAPDEAQAKRALAEPSAQDPAGERYAREWRKLLALPDPRSGLARVQALGAWGLFDARLNLAWGGFPGELSGPIASWRDGLPKRWDEAWASLVANAHWQGAGFAERWEAGLALLLALAQEAMPEWGEGGWGGRLEAPPALALRWMMPKEAIRRVALAVGAARALALGLAPSRAMAPVAHFKGLQGLGPSMLAALAAAVGPGEAQDALWAHLEQDRLVRLEVDGATLQALGLPPGPRYAELLDHLLAGRLSGRLADGASEGAEAKAWVQAALEAPDGF